MEGNALAILPCFMAEPNSKLVPILPDELMVTRHFWLCCREDLRKLRRITSLWDYLRAVADENRSLLMGESAQMTFVEV
jgi:DNA-binding transcriptional LysR family regulator